jgi:integral membrane protein
MSFRSKFEQYGQTTQEAPLMGWFAAEELIKEIRRFRLISVVEGITLLGVTFVALPLKYLGVCPEISGLIGPLHGGAFVLYCGLLIQAVFSQGFRRRDIAFMAIASIVPFGAFVNERLLRRRELALIRMQWEQHFRIK